jgi:DNA-directed RNA polymerase subunit RPC12/RpoP
MLKTRLYVECPNCYMQYLMKDRDLTYSNGAFIENVAGAPEMQRLLCPCRPGTPHKFKLREAARLHLFSQDESERTHFLLPKKKPPIWVPAKGL